MIYIIIIYNIKMLPLFQVAVWKLWLSKLLLLKISRRKHTVPGTKGAYSSTLGVTSCHGFRILRSSLILMLTNGYGWHKIAQSCTNFDKDCFNYQHPSRFWLSSTIFHIWYVLLYTWCKTNWVYQRILYWFK